MIAELLPHRESFSPRLNRVGNDMTIEIDLGTAVTHGQTEARAMLDVEELLATRLLVQGNSGSGKSHLLRRLLEQSARYVQQLVVDPEGDYVSLADKFGHVVIDADRSKSDLEAIAIRVRQHRVSAVLNLENLDIDGQMKAAAIFLNAMFEVERDYWYPCLVSVDEAQLFAPAAAGDVSEEARKVSLAAMTNLMCRGRKRGLAGIMATQRLAKLAKNCAAEATNFLFGRTYLDLDIARAGDLLGIDRRQAEMFRDLQRGQFMALGPALSRRPLRVHVGPVETTAGGSTPRLTPPPEKAPEEIKELILAPVPTNPAAASAPRRAPRSPAPSTNELLAQMLREEPASDVGGAEPASDVSPEEREQSFRTILAEMMADADAHERPEAVLFQDFLVRCRIKRVGGEAPKLPEFRRHLNTARAGVDPETAGGEEWGRVMAIATTIDEDTQGVFLLLARAAMIGAPCPSDLDAARICGTSSAARARIRIQSLDRQGIVVMRSDLGGRRIAVIPDLGWETAGGDPNAPANPLPSVEHEPALAETGT